MRPTALPLCLALLSAGCAQAADPPAAPADELDALSLADKAPSETAQPVQPWRVFVEGAAGRNSVAGFESRVNTQRASIDLRLDASLAPGWRAVLSDRVDLAHSNGVPPAEDVNTLREAHLSWAVSDHQVVDLGRVNVRNGAAMGFNPTDWFKENALRSVVSPDPAVLRENRQGTVVLQGQQLWGSGALTATLSPKLADEPDPDAFAIDFGATNPRNRWLLAGSYKFSDTLNPQMLLYGGADTPTQLGLNLSALAGDAAVVFGEFAAGKGRGLVAQALGLAEAQSNQQRAAVGFTYTTGFNLSLTAEAQYNSAAPTGSEWDALDPAARLGVLATAEGLQDLPVRQAWFFHATWKDLLLRRLDLSAFVRFDAETDSRHQWLEARYHWDHVDLSVQWQRFAGDEGSVFGSVPRRQAVEVALRYYF
ncbi:MAG: hypothetical protein U5L05_16205 [Rubrivivax sp.]|nr:hypothetical protein [Rubrivivax sp.]